MSYAVVRFIKDNDYSEVPSLWLNEEKNQCWWPKIKNVSQYINHKMIPDPTTWANYDVEFQGHYETLQLARKKAEDSNCTSTEESLCRGKGQRKKKKKVMTSGSETSEDLDSKDYEPPPRLTLEDKNVTKSNKRQKFSAFNASHDCASLSSSTRDICEMKVLYTEPPNNENNQNNNNIISMSDIPIIIAPSTHVSSGIETAATHHEEIGSIQKLVTNATNTSNVYDKIQKRILQECTLIKIYIQNIDTRLKRLEDGKIKEKNNSYEEVQIIQNQLPLKTIDQVSHFDQSMEDENIKKAFIMFIKRIGGNTATDNVKAILKRIFTNELGTQCSWLGQRNNFKICDLSLIAIIKDVILSVHYDFQEIHFRKVVSEWLRLSKLRFSRDQKHRHGIQANADNLPEEN